MAGPLLIHSMAEFRPLILPVLDAVAPKRIVELGGEGGTMTELLAGWATEHGATVTCIDPLPSPHLRALGGDGRVELVVGKSPGALADLEPFDLYVVDGDHNHHVVTGELRMIFEDRERFPLALMHDVAWPAARRDQYYDPEDVPPEHRRPYDHGGGAVPGESRLQADRGFTGEGSFAYAVDEGGPANGVLTAVEDLLAEREDLELRRVPAVFGLGAVYPIAAPWAAQVRNVLDPFHENELLIRLEENRLALYLEVIDRRRATAGMARGQRELVAGLEREISALRTENARLRAAVADVDNVPDRAGPTLS